MASQGAEGRLPVPGWADPGSGNADAAAVAANSIDSDANSTDDALRQWQAAKAELEDIDKVIRDLRAELQQFGSRREVVARREEALRRALPKAAAASDQPVTPPRTAEFSVETPQAAPEPLFFHLGAHEDSPMVQGSPAAPREVASALPARSSRQIEDWERGLESFGVAKCGVCGLKFPLDVGAIEKHCLECEGAQKDGKRATRPDGGLDSVGDGEAGRQGSHPEQQCAATP